MGTFVDVHSHVVPSGDDGVGSVEEGLELCIEAARRGTRILYVTPHVWPHLPLSDEREETVRSAHAAIAEAAAPAGVDVRLGFELTPAVELLEQDPARYRLARTSAVLMEIPFAGPLGVTVRLAEHIEAAGLTPILAHPERSEAMFDDPRVAEGLRERGWLVQVNSTSLLGRDGPDRERLGWLLVQSGVADLVASDGHRRMRPPFLEKAHAAVVARLGDRERADALFDGSALPTVRSAAGGGVDLAQRR